tara:strand:- start:4180 stop:4311 length:132 start_codon:yes stop_codon:yes gene_type:complete
MVYGLIKISDLMVTLRFILEAFFLFSLHKLDLGINLMRRTNYE